MSGKFKVWDSINKEWFDETTAVLGQDGRLKFWNMYKKELEPLCESTYILVESTGIADCNGVKIFNGDILTAINENTGSKLIGKIFFDPNRQFCIDHGLMKDGRLDVEYRPDVNGFFGSGTIQSTHGNGRTDWQIIGSIYENPELLQK